jgi:O-acetyl-ADP-ribose deacetylase (regulator of RNase III)
VTLFAGELLDAPAEALCTSTNPRLSLGGGTGRSVLEETGWGLKRRLEEIAAAEAVRTGAEELPVGFTCSTPGGRPPHRLIVHCVASARAHRSSPEAARRCTEGALSEADRAGCETLALPVFGTGHADLPYDQAVQAMAGTLRDARPRAIRTVYLVVFPPHRAALARQILDRELASP